MTMNLALLKHICLDGGDYQVVTSLSDFCSMLFSSPQHLCDLLSLLVKIFIVLPSH